MSKPNKPRIIISSYDDLENPYYGGGGAASIQEIASRLNTEFQITVLCGMFPGAKDEVVRQGVRYLRIGSASVGAKLGQVAFSALLPYYARRLRYDMWIESFTPPFSTSLLPLVTDKPVIGLVHMLGAEDMERKYHLPFRLVENIGLKWYRSFIVPNPAIQHQILKINPSAEVTLIPNGVDLPLKSASNNKGKHILYIGRLEVNQKGIDLLIKSYAKIKNKISYPLYIAGSGETSEINSIKKLIKKLGMTDRIQLVGRVAGEKKDELYRNSAFVVCPSRFETFSMIALETMSYKKAFVCFDIAGLSWIPEDYRMTAPGFNIEALAESMLTLCKNPRLARAIGVRSYGLLKEYEWNNSAKKYREFIYEVARRQPVFAPAWQEGVGV